MDETQLQEEIERLRGRVYELERSLSEADGSLGRQLKERIKELNCLYQISKLRERRPPREEMLRGILELIPSAWQHPDYTRARFHLEGETIGDSIDQEAWKLSTPITLHDQKVGVLEVAYVGPNTEVSPFLEEEQRLLEAIVESVDSFLEQQRAEENAQLQHQHLIQLDKLAALGTLVSGVAHEINNPNNFVMLNAPILKETWESVQPILEEYHDTNGDFLLGGLPFSDMRTTVPALFGGILDGARRIRSIVDSLKGFARMETPEMNETVSVNDVVKSSLILLSNLIKQSTNRFEVRYDEELPAVKGNMQRLEQVVTNLVQNACESLTDRSQSVRIVTSFNQKAERVEVSVADQGVGIVEENLPKIMNPFFTTKRDRGGTGLGLSVSAGILEEHGGSLTFSSNEETGTTATVNLPAAESHE